MTAPTIAPRVIVITSGITCVNVGKLKVAISAIAIPIIPIILPVLADFGDDKPFNANIKQMAEAR
jgi:hypothetical protein